MRRLALLATAVLVPLTPLLPASPAYAVAHVICVNNPSGVSCDEGLNTIPEAISSANANVEDPAITIVVAPGGYNDGPYVLNGNSDHSLTLQGSGQGSTFITLPSSAGTQPYVTANDATVRDLTVSMNAAQSAGDVGIDAGASTLDSVTVDGTGTTTATGVELSDSTLTRAAVQMPLPGASESRGVYSDSATSVTDSTIVAGYAFEHSDPGVTAVVSRVSIKASGAGISTDWGTVAVDDTLIDLGDAGNAAAGLAAQNTNPSAIPKSIIANHVTIVGGGPGSYGVFAGSLAEGAVQATSIQLLNSIVSGPDIDLWAGAGNLGGLGSDSTATITTSYSVWSTHEEHSDPNGIATLVSGPGHLSVNPYFRNPTGGDYRLAAGSPLIDRGAPGTAGPTLDLDRHARVLDGNGDGLVVRDLGAYESPRVPDTTAPGTTLTSHPHKTTTKRRVGFTFTSNDPRATFQCKLDRKPWRSCTSPKRYKVAVGWHKFKVRARDAAGNLDPTPAKFRFHRV